MAQHEPDAHGHGEGGEGDAPARQNQPTAAATSTEPPRRWNAATDAPEPSSPDLLAAIANREVERALEMARRGHGVGFVKETSMRETPLHEAAYAPWPESVELVRVLLDRGADPNLQGNNIGSPLHWTCESRQTDDCVAEKLKALLRANGDPSRKDPRGDSPLHLAVFFRQIPSAVEVLVRAGADPTSLDRVYRTPTDWAVIEGRYGGLESPQLWRVLALLGGGLQMETFMGALHSRSGAQAAARFLAKDGDNHIMMRVARMLWADAPSLRALARRLSAEDDASDASSDVGANVGADADGDGVDDGDDDEREEEEEAPVLDDDEDDNDEDAMAAPQLMA